MFDQFSSSSPKLEINNWLHIRSMSRPFSLPTPQRKFQNTSKFLVDDSLIHNKNDKIEVNKKIIHIWRFVCDFENERIIYVFV